MDAIVRTNQVGNTVALISAAVCLTRTRIPTFGRGVGMRMKDSNDHIPWQNWG